MDTFLNMFNDMFGNESSLYYLGGGLFILIFLYLLFKKLRPKVPNKPGKKPQGAPAGQPTANEMAADKKMAKIAAKAAKEAKKKAEAAAKLAAKHKGKLPKGAPAPLPGDPFGQPGQNAFNQGFNGNPGPAPGAYPPPAPMGPPPQAPAQAGPAWPQAAPGAPLMATLASPVPESQASPAPGSFRAVQLRPAGAPGPAPAPQPSPPPVAAPAPPAPEAAVIKPAPPVPEPSPPPPEPPAPKPEPPVAAQPEPPAQALEGPAAPGGVRISTGGQSAVPPVPAPGPETGPPAVEPIEELVLDEPLEAEPLEAEPLEAEALEAGTLETVAAPAPDGMAHILDVESVPDLDSPGAEARTQTLVQTSPLESDGDLAAAPGAGPSPPPAKPMAILEGRGGVLKASQTQMSTPIQIDQTQLPRVMKEAAAAAQAAQAPGPVAPATVTVQELDATYQKNIFLNPLEIVYYKLLRAAFTQFLIFPKVTSRAAVTVISKNADHLKVAENVLTNTTVSFVVCDVKLNIRAIIEVIDEKLPPTNKDRARDYILKKAGLLVVRFYGGDTPPDVSTLRKLLGD
ncbi:MAG: DUF2726 domain-containing protein [Deltaproteobacteria bacterium]|jgi:hypothetical protein|nr:DUF2726 domain-containing protein [Deltaproteobacteria bacterium]